MTIERIATGVPGLDDVLGGGLLKAGAYIVQGAPGAGKTILANQICFHHVATGGRVAYVTLLAESHARLMQHLQVLSFYRASAIPESIYYVSAFDALRTGGLEAVVALLRREMRVRQAGLVVLDGLVLAAMAAGSDQALKLFISEIQAHSILTGCTTLLLTSSGAGHVITPEQTMVDGIVLLREQEFGPRRERHLEVAKLRGSATLRGSHAFRIGTDGITVFPRLEAARTEPPPRQASGQVASTGVPGLDGMIGLGGLPAGSITVVEGPTGSGKTTLALHFAGQATPEAPALWFGFFEAPDFLEEVGETFGMGMAALRASGAVEFLWQPNGENILDELAYRLLDAVRRRGARRVIIDGLGGFKVATAYPERSGIFFSSLANELRRLGATTLITAETGDQESRVMPVPAGTLSSLSDNLFRLQVSRGENATRRFMAIGKVRNSRYDVRVRELLLEERGLVVDRRVPEPGSPGAAGAMA